MSTTEGTTFGESEEDDQKWEIELEVSLCHGSNSPNPSDSDGDFQANLDALSGLGGNLKRMLRLAYSAGFCSGAGTMFRHARNADRDFEALPQPEDLSLYREHSSVQLENAIQRSHLASMLRRLDGSLPSADSEAGR